MFQSIAYVALGGAAGSVLRHLSVLGALRVFGSAPLGVMLVNIAGSFVIGVLAGRLGASAHPLLVTGFLGGFTTFSAFSLDALRLWETAPASALFYVIGSVGLSLLAVACGAFLARSLS